MRINTKQNYTFSSKHFLPHPNDYDYNKINIYFPKIQVFFDQRYYWSFKPMFGNENGSSTH